MNLAQIVYTFGDMLMFGLICLFVAFSCGMAAARDARIAKERRERRNIGAVIHRQKVETGAQVLRSQGLSISRQDGFETEGRLAHDYEPEEQPSDVSTHSEN